MAIKVFQGIECQSEILHIMEHMCVLEFISCSVDIYRHNIYFTQKLDLTKQLHKSAHLFWVNLSSVLNTSLLSLLVGEQNDPASLIFSSSFYTPVI